MRLAVPLRHHFVDSVPERMEEGILYVSVKYRSVIHLCACGCRNEVVTPLSPTDWRLTFDGVSISLDPSVGNWSLPCRSHYIIRRSNAVWAGDWSEERIAAGRAHDRRAKDIYYGRKEGLPKSQAPLPDPRAESTRSNFLGRTLELIFGKADRSKKKR